jgi:hypothetical protein
MLVCRYFWTGATGLEPATSGVTGRYGFTRCGRLAPETTGWSRHFLVERTGCDPVTSGGRPVEPVWYACGRRGAYSDDGATLWALRSRRFHPFPASAPVRRRLAEWVMLSTAGPTEPGGPDAKWISDALDLASSRVEDATVRAFAAA